MIELKCLDCGEKMEREDGAKLYGEPANALYQCPNCGGEWVWRCGKKMMQIESSVLGVDVLMTRLQEKGLVELANDKYAETPPIRSEDYA